MIAVVRIAAIITMAVLRKGDKINVSYNIAF